MNMKSVKLTIAQQKVQNLYKNQYNEAKDYLQSVWNKEEYNMIDIPKKYFNKEYGCYSSEEFFADLVKDEKKSFNFIKKYKDNITAMAYFYVFSLKFRIKSIEYLYCDNGYWINMNNTCLQR